MILIVICMLTVRLYYIIVYTIVLLHAGCLGARLAEQAQEQAVRPHALPVVLLPELLPAGASRMQ